MDARMPERYLVDRRIVRLTDAQRSSYLMATLWSVSNRTDGRIERADLALIPTFDQGSVDALVRAGLWERDASSDAWLIDDYMTTQTSRADFEVLENARRADREKKRRQRAAKAESDSRGASPGHVPGDSTGKDRQGKDRQGQASERAQRTEAISQQTGSTCEAHGLVVDSSGRCGECYAIEDGEPF